MAPVQDPLKLNPGRLGIVIKLARAKGLRRAARNVDSAAPSKTMRFVAPAVVQTMSGKAAQPTSHKRRVARHHSRERSVTGRSICSAEPDLINNTEWEASGRRGRRWLCSTISTAPARIGLFDVTANGSAVQEPAQARFRCAFPRRHAYDLVAMLLAGWQALVRFGPAAGSARSPSARRRSSTIARP